MENTKKYKLNDEFYVMKLTKDEYILVDKYVTDYNKSNTFNISEYNKKLKDLDFMNIFLYGKDTELSFSQLEDIIKPVKLRSNDVHKYPCYAVENTNFITHNNVAASWDCFINTIGNTEYVAILKY